MDDFASHMKLFRKAETKVRETKGKVEDEGWYCIFYVHCVNPVWVLGNFIWDSVVNK